MYLSKLIVNPKSKMVRRDIVDPYNMHRTLSRGFDFEVEGGTGRVLFRIDKNSTILIVSKQRPDWSNLPPDYLSDAFPPLDYTEHHFQKGDQFYFRLRANPTVKRVMGKENSSVRRGLYTFEEQTQWMHRKAEMNGFALLTLSVFQEGLILCSKGIQLFSVLYEGALGVTDPGDLKKALHNGIGSGKGFGFGLLSIARG